MLLTDDIDKALWNTQEAAQAVAVKPVTIRQWKHRGLLKVAGLDERGRPLYRVLDVLRVENATRARARRDPWAAFIAAQARANTETK